MKDMKDMKDTKDIKRDNNLTVTLPARSRTIIFVVRFTISIDIERRRSRGICIGEEGAEDSFPFPFPFPVWIRGMDDTPERESSLGRDPFENVSSEVEEVVVGIV